MASPATTSKRPPNNRASALRRPHETHLAWARNSGMSALLALLAIGMFVLPALLPYGHDWRVLANAMLTLVFVTGVVAIVDHRRLAAALVVLGAAVIALRWAEWALAVKVGPLVRDLSTLAAVGVLATTVGINVFTSRRAVGNRIFGAIVLYLLLGLMWTVAYAMVAVTVPEAFAGQPPSGDDFFGWGYFSLVTLTTVGYGDITPVARVARSLATAEALVGQLYPAIIIARLVSLQSYAR